MWTDEASCAGARMDWFFDPVDINDDGRRLCDERGLAHARSFCVRCPVRRECAESAMAFEANDPEPFRFGIFGGLTPMQRSSLNRRGVESWRCSSCHAVYDPVLLQQGQLACPNGCDVRLAAPVSDLGDQWADRHTRLAKDVISWVETVADGTAVQSPTSYARQHGIRKDDCCRVWRALVEDGVLVQEGRGRYRKNPGQHALRARSGVVHRGCSSRTLAAAPSSSEASQLFSS